jgi:hypothetical protein
LKIKATCVVSGETVIPGETEGSLFLLLPELTMQEGSRIPLVTAFLGGGCPYFANKEGSQ